MGFYEVRINKTVRVTVSFYAFFQSNLQAKIHCTELRRLNLFCFYFSECQHCYQWKNHWKIFLTLEQFITKSTDNNCYSQISYNKRCLFNQEHHGHVIP